MSGSPKTIAALLDEIQKATGTIGDEFDSFKEASVPTEKASKGQYAQNRRQVSVHIPATVQTVLLLVSELKAELGIIPPLEKTPFSRPSPRTAKIAGTRQHGK